MSFDNLLVERDGRTGLLTIQRPQRLNALDARTLDELRQALLAFQQDDDIRCVILTGAAVNADEALAAGLVNRVVPAANLMKESRAFAAELSSKAPIALRHAMDAINRGAEMPFADACQLEAALFGMVTATEDMREGTRAFLEKRKPVFKGR